MLDDQSRQCPADRRSRQLRPRLSRCGGVLAPHVPAARAAVAAHPDQQRRGTPAEWLVRQAPDHRAAPDALGATTAAPLVRLHDSAGDHGTIGLKALPDSDEAELVQAREGGQVRASEGSVRHVEVFQMRRVGTFIIGRPRPLPGHRRADRSRHHAYTLICDEPRNGALLAELAATTAERGYTLAAAARPEALVSEAGAHTAQLGFRRPGSPRAPGGHHGRGGDSDAASVPRARPLQRRARPRIHSRTSSGQP